MKNHGFGRWDHFYPALYIRNIFEYHIHECFFMNESVQEVMSGKRERLIQ